MVLSSSLTPYKLGYSTGVFYPLETDLVVILEKLLKYNQDLVEINVGTPQELNSAINKNVFSLAKKFANVTIHAPMQGMVYDSKSEGVIDQLLELAKQTNARYVLFHPDIVRDFELIDRKMGSLAAFENMDVRKSFGSTVEDMKKVFEVCKTAQWVCDLNHIFTIDRSMKLSESFHSSLWDRLAGYHISAFKDDKTLHTCFYLNHENEILDALQKKEALIIHEGGEPTVEGFLEKEDLFVRDFLSRKNVFS